MTIAKIITELAMQQINAISNETEEILSYTGNLFAKSDRCLHLREHRQALAWYLRAQGLTGEAAYDWIVEQIYQNHSGDLFNVKDEWLNPDALRPYQFWGFRFLSTSVSLNTWRQKNFPSYDWGEISFEMRDLFGEDVKGTMNKFLLCADEAPARRLDQHVVPRIMFIDFAVEIHVGARRQIPERDGD
ncbi:hypothetical protein [uncultured Roseobacter sp.]|uniref:hypothetical protein n=1 Tax=uncultured Roseobacter sp. TaxID=114847 RepID=UPI002629A879|nr:hypothetical protein [uncultured Roseobacter sp.]